MRMLNVQLRTQVTLYQHTVLRNGRTIPQLIAATRNEKQLTWIGLKKPNYPANATWAWTDGSVVDYFNWANGKPADITGLQNCAQMYTDSLDKNPAKDTDFRRWNDVQCSTAMRSYVCKKPALH
ncbi:lectin C-type domain protein [Ancylostoma ceylanicum]|uniref:Lectin C-type domain protein n=1 Tax=Ancylostoma ceylanicum TaxID=53326 RepID=A0A0D6M8P0_9BILA|nr:lectin C-type domain protein [Ancylostoma ceylanicum]